jgi:hypothetical protein
MLIMFNATPKQCLLNNHFVNPPTDLSIGWKPRKTRASAFNVPRSINYVWVGEKRIPDSALRNIYRMHQTNCSQKSLNSFKIFIWTDKPKRILESMYNAEKSDDLILSELARNNKYSKITVEHYSELFKDSRNQNIADHKVKLYLEGLVTRNLYGPFRNYACASDILRLFALNLGGIYLDVDVSVIDKIPESCLTNKHGLKIYYQDGYFQNNCMIAAPNDWVIKNLLMLMCKHHEHEDINMRYGEHRFSTDEQLNVTWHQQRSLQTHINADGKEANIRKELTVCLTGPSLYDLAYACICNSYMEVQRKKNAAVFNSARDSIINSGDSISLISSEKKYLSSLSSSLESKSLLKTEKFCTRYWIKSKVFNNYEDPKEYVKSPEAHKPFFAHGVVYGVAPSGYMEDKLDSWCTVDTNTKHHDTSDIPI